MKLEETAEHYRTAVQWIAHSPDDFGSLVDALSYSAVKGKRHAPGMALLWGIPVVFKEWCPPGEILVVSGTEEDALKSAFS